MRHGSLFSGVGGWSVASDQMNWQTVFCCEWDENKQYVLKYHWPKSEIYGDITKTDFTKWRGLIDVLTASTPCQPFSLAGKRQGSDDIRHLWPETLRAVREIQPPFFVLENVPGLVNWSKGMVFQQIIADLENEGYEVLPFLLPACGVNAPHKRERIWIIAHNKEIKRHKRCEPESDNDKWEASQYITNNREGIRNTIRPTCESGTTPDTTGNGWTRQNNESGGMYRKGISNTPLQSCQQWHAPNTNSSQRRERGMYQKGRKEAERYFGLCDARDNTRGNWTNFPTVGPLRSGDDGFSRDALRLFINENSGGLLTEKEVNQIISKSLNKWNNETIAAGGDAVVNACVLQIFKAIKEASDMTCQY